MIDSVPTWVHPLPLTRPPSQALEIRNIDMRKCPRQFRADTYPNFNRRVRIFAFAELQVAENGWFIGLIVVWPQRKKFRNWKTLALVSWFIAHTMYFLYLTNILPSARVIAISKPPWNCKKKIRRPLRRDYIIEPDWDSWYHNNLTDNFQQINYTYKVGLTCFFNSPLYRQYDAFVLNHETNTFFFRCRFHFEAYS